MVDNDSRRIFAENLTRLMRQNQKTQSDLVTDLNIKQTTLSDWINGKNFPRIGKIELLANYFNVQKSDLIEKYDPEKSNVSLEEYVKLNKKLPNVMQVLFRDGGKMTPEREKLVARIIETAIEEK